MTLPGLAAEIPAGMPPAARELVEAFEQGREKAEEPLHQLRVQYLERLEGLQTQRQQQGDLDGALAVAEEIRVVLDVPPEAGSEEAKEPPAELERIRRIYEHARSERLLEIRREVEPRAKAVNDSLGKMQQELTRAGKLDEAIALKGFLDAGGVLDSIKAIEVAGQERTSRTGDVRLRIQVDGVSHLLLRGDEIWFDHTRGSNAPPGLHQGTFPTYINHKTEWQPHWAGNITKRYDAGLGLPTEGEPVEIRSRVSDGRGTVEVVEQPGPGNDYTAKVQLRDKDRNGKGFFGSDWIDFRLSW